MRFSADFEQVLHNAGITVSDLEAGLSEADIRKLDIEVGNQCDEANIEGYGEGFDEGYDEGYDVGYDEGHDEGFLEGHDRGYSEANRRHLELPLPSVEDADL